MKRCITRSIFIFLTMTVVSGTASAQMAGFRTPVKYVGNARSHFLHLIYYQHLPPEALQVRFKTLDEALRAGYRKCPICFPATTLVPGYDFERRLGMETAGIVNYYYPTPGEPRYTKKLRRESEEVLSLWPFPLKGYHYSFLAVKSEEIKAFSCAGGLIYLTTGLMDILESKGELDMILAHEISHVEQRHAMNEFQLEGAGFLQNDPVSAAERLSDFARNLVLVGYSDRHEREADFYALAYGAQNLEGDSASLSLVLRKLNDVQWRDIRTGGGLFSGRSDLEGRMQAIHETRIKAFSPAATFYRRRSGGKVDTRLNLLFQRLYRGRLILYAAIEADEMIPFNSQGKSQSGSDTGDAPDPHDQVGVPVGGH